MLTPKEKYITTNTKRPNSRHFARYRQIAQILAKYRLKEMLQATGLEQFLPALRWLSPVNPWRKQIADKPQRTRMAIEELGTSFVKVGQIISTRSDMLPPEFSQELSQLQDSLKPLPIEVIKQVIVEELGHPIEEIFASFDPKPIGVASIGQAHAATLKDGTEVVVKARKPGVVEQVREDMDILRQVAANAVQRWEYSQLYDLRGIAEEVAETIASEMDYVREGHSAEHFARFFQADSMVHVPKVIWQYTTSRVITLERIKGININDIDGLDKAGHDRKELATRAANLWIKMVFEDGIFHADPHPGNLFVESGGKLGLIDFGMIGTVDDEARERLTDAIRAIMDRSVDRFLDAIIELGAVPPLNTREGLRADLKHLMGHYPLSLPNLQISSSLTELFAIIRRNHIQLPSNTFLLLKTMAMAQSLGERLDPDYNFFAALAEEGERVFKKKYSPTGLVRRLPGAIADLAALGVGLPQRISRLVRSVERGEIQIRTDVSGFERHFEHLERIVNRLLAGIILASVILGGAIIVLTLRLGR